MLTAINESGLTWVEIQNPTEDDVRYLKKKFKFHPLVLGEIIPPGHRPKVERHGNYLFMIFYYPVYAKDAGEPHSRELDVIVTKNALITSHYNESIAPVVNLFKKCQADDKFRIAHTKDGVGELLYYALSAFWKSCLEKLEGMDEKLDKIEDCMFEGEEKKMVLEISKFKAEVINFWRIIEPQEEILDSLAKEGESFFGPSFLPHIADIQGTYGKVRNSLETYKETIFALEGTNKSLLSTKANETIQILTVFSVILLPLNLIASAWGMNINMPFSDSRFAFFIVSALMFAVLGLMVTLFRKKQWL